MSVPIAGHQGPDGAKAPTPAKDIGPSKPPGPSPNQGPKRQSVDPHGRSVGSFGAASSLGAGGTPTGSHRGASFRPPKGASHKGSLHHPSPSPSPSDPALHARMHLERKTALGLLDKKFTFVAHGVKIRPDHLFSTDPFQLPELQALKAAVNAEKDKLDRLDLSEWERHSVQVNRSGGVVPHLRNTLGPELCTIAWSKMYETLVSMRLVSDQIKAAGQPLVSAHLCEAPGAFVSALNHFLKGPGGPRPTWHWLASTLNPYFEGNDSLRMNDDDALIAHTYRHWYFGEDNTGDIRRPHNIRSLWARVRTLPGGQDGAHVATGDGAIDTQSDPNEQEMINATLHYCELVAALGCLRVGGSLMIKSFSMFEHPMCCKLFLLTALFDEFTVFKPSTSKAANSETYLCGRGFKGIDPKLLEALLSHCADDVFRVGTPEARAMLPLDLMPPAFLRQVVACAHLFADQQVRVLREAVELMAPHNRAHKDLCWKTRGWFAEEWVRRMGVGPLAPQDQLTTSGLKGNRNNTSIGVLPKLKFKGTLEQRKTEIEKRDRLLGTSAPSSTPTASLTHAASPKWKLRATAAPWVPSSEASATASAASSAATGASAPRPASPPRTIIGFGKEVAADESESLGDLLHSDFAHVHGRGRAAPPRKSQDAHRPSPTPDPGTPQQGPGAGRTPSKTPPPRSELTAGVLSQKKQAAKPGQDEAARAALDPRPDCEWTANEFGPVCAEESRDWEPSTSRRCALLRSKTCDDEALVALMELRRDNRPRGVGRSHCPHTPPCHAPPPPPPAAPCTTTDRGFWKLQALDHALDLLGPLAADSGRPTVLDLARSAHAGAAQYLGTRPEPWTLLTLREAEPAPGTLAGRVVHGGFPVTASCEEIGRWCEAVTGGGGGGGGGVDLVISAMGSYSERFGAAAAVRSVEMELAAGDRIAWLQEALVTLAALRTGGTAVLRVGDLFTRFYSGVVYMLYRCFSRMCILKPFASCASCGEKFLVLQGFLGQADATQVRAYLARLVTELEAQPPDIVFADALPPPCWIGSSFYQYMAPRIASLVRFESASLLALKDASRRESESQAQEGHGGGSTTAEAAERYLATPRKPRHNNAASGGGGMSALHLGFSAAAQGSGGAAAGPHAVHVAESGVAAGSWTTADGHHRHHQ